MCSLDKKSKKQLYKTVSINQFIHSYVKTPSYNVFYLTTLIVSLFGASFLNPATAETNDEKLSKPLNEVEFLGLNLVQANLNTVRTICGI